MSGIISQENMGLVDGSGGFGDGIAIFNSSTNVLGNTVRHTAPFDGIGVSGHSSSGNKIVANRLATRS